MKQVSRSRTRAFIAATLTALLVVPTAIVSIAAAPAAANVPARHVEGVGCTTDAQGHASCPWHVPSSAPGTVVFQGQGSATVTQTDGLDTELAGGQAYARWFGGTSASFFTVQVAGPPSSSCDVGIVLSERPANSEIAGAEALRGRTGNVEGTTRAASIDPTTTAAPVPGALH